MSAPTTGADLLARIKPTRREEIVELCLRPDLLDEHAAKDAELADSIARDGAAGRLASGTTARTKKLAQQVQALEAEIEATAARFRMMSMPKDQWRALCDNHPPRKGNDMDFYAGHNRDAVQDAAVRLCLVDPVFEDCTEKGCTHEACGSWQAFASVINPSEWAELRASVSRVNGVVTEAPKSVLASRSLARRGTTSARPATGE